jgi:hypothetical protein
MAIKVETSKCKSQLSGNPERLQRPWGAVMLRLPQDRHAIRSKRLPVRREVLAPTIVRCPCLRGSAKASIMTVMVTRD